MKLQPQSFQLLSGSLQKQITLVYEAVKRLASRVATGVNHNSDTRPTNGETWIGL